MVIMWTLLGALGILSIWRMASYLENAGLVFYGFDWGVYLIWVFWTLFGAAFVWTSIKEKELRAARRGFLVFGGISIITALLLMSMWGIL